MELNHFEKKSSTSIFMIYMHFFKMATAMRIKCTNDVKITYPIVP